MSEQTHTHGTDKMWSLNSEIEKRMANTMEQDEGGAAGTASQWANSPETTVVSYLPLRSHTPVEETFATWHEASLRKTQLKMDGMSNVMIVT